MTTTTMNITERIESIQSRMEHLDRIIDAAEAAKADALDAISDLEDCEGDERASQEVRCDLDAHGDEIEGGLLDLRASC